MAERIHWGTYRWLECRIIHLSICLSIHLSFFSPYWSICLSTYPSLCLSIHLLSSLSVYAAVHPSSYFCLCVHLSIFLSTSLFQDLSFPCLSICLLSCGLSIYLAVYLFIHLSTEAFHPSIQLFIFPSRECDSKQVTFAHPRHRANRPLVLAVV